MRRRQGVNGERKGKEFAISEWKRTREQVKDWTKTAWDNRIIEHNNDKKIRGGILQNRKMERTSAHPGMQSCCCNASTPTVSLSYCVCRHDFDKVRVRTLERLELRCFK